MGSLIDAPPARYFGDYFVSRQFDAAKPFLVQHRKITPEMLTAEDSVPDYERMFAGTEEMRPDGFWTAEPFAGIPWWKPSSAARSTPARRASPASPGLRP